ncbi:MAG: adenylate/guanylate cyclase domain-containing protein [Verrucomicrobiota bacterium]
MQLAESPVKGYRLAWLTFLAVFAVTALVGIAVVPVLIRQIEREYLLVQADINERQAKSLAQFASLRLQEGISREEVTRELQALLTGADADRGYSCVVDRDEATFVCHPMTMALGMSVATKEASFVDMADIDSQKGIPWEAALQSGIFGSGSLFYPDGASEIIFMEAIPETEWTVTTHENTARVSAELEAFRQALIVGSFLVGFLLAVPSSLAARAVSRRHEKRVEAEQQRSERLLLNILPPAIAERLKNNEATIADRHPAVTVLFADIVGFTPWAAKTSAEDLVARLNRIFSRFDDICVAHGLEKIKTIGDAYMLCGGIDGDSEEGARSVIAAAKEMLNAIREETEDLESDRPLTLRIGVHTGELVAGVIGKRKFSYDLWGDVVNTSSRMESSGIPGEIQVSAETRALLGESVALQSRGNVELKGKGETPVWIVS